MTHIKVDDIFYGWFFDADEMVGRMKYYYEDEDQTNHLLEKDDIDDIDVTTIKFSGIDRGVESFRYFADELNFRFPSLSHLEFHQNYSIDESMDSFLYLIERLQLHHLKIVDFQTKLFRKINEIEYQDGWQRVLKAMPDGAIYSIESDVCLDTHYINGEVQHHDINETMQVFKEGNRELIVNIGNCPFC